MGQCGQALHYIPFLESYTAQLGTAISEARSAVESVSVVNDMRLRTG